MIIRLHEGVSGYTAAGASRVNRRASGITRGVAVLVAVGASGQWPMAEHLLLEIVSHNNYEEGVLATARIKPLWPSPQRSRNRIRP
eukprot:6213499-Pleurochrysis_carterae.AAC.2